MSFLRYKNLPSRKVIQYRRALKNLSNSFMSKNNAHM